MIELAQPLQRLETSELIRRLAESNAGGIDLAYLFKHALVQDTAYSSLLKNERRRLHRLIGESLEQIYPDAVQDNAALLVKHYVEAGDDAKILEYGTCAGDAEARIFAKTEAIEHYKAAFEAAIRLNVSAQVLIDLATKLGRVSELRDDYMLAIETYARLSALAETRGEPALELAGLMPQGIIRATPTSVFEPQTARELCARALTLAHELQDGAAEAKILWILLLVNGFTGHYEEAVEYGEQSLALARKLGLKTQIAYTLNDLGNYGYFSMAQPDKSRLALQEARALWRELDNLPMLDDNLNNSGILEYMRGNFAAGLAFSDEALALSEVVGSTWGESLARAFRGVVSVETGDFGSGLRELEAAYNIADRSGSGIKIISASNLALLYGLLGNVAEGYRIIQFANAEIEIGLYRAPAKAALAYLTYLHGEVELAQQLLVDARPRSQDKLQFSYIPSILAEGEMGLAAGRCEYVVEYMASLAQSLPSWGISNFVADAELYRGRALIQLGRLDDARGAFANGYAYATRIGSQRALWQLAAHWSQLEAAQNNLSQAQALLHQAQSIHTGIANTLPLIYRPYFETLAPSDQERSTNNREPITNN